MKKHTKQRLFEVMSRLDSTFKPRLNEDYFDNYDDIYDDKLSEEKSSYSTKILDDIKIILGNKDSLSDVDINQIATSNNVDREEVLRSLDYVKSERLDTTSIPSSSVEAEEVNDFFKFLNNNPQKGSKATVEYVSSLNRNLAKPKTNPMVNKFVKLTKYSFEWERTYKKETEKVNPEWDLQKRKGNYTKMEGGYSDVMERDASGDEVLPIVPRTPKSMILVLDDNGNVVDKVDSKGLQEKYSEYFQPSFFTPYTSGSGVDFRPLKLYAINRIAAGGKEWINPKLKPPFNKYRQYFNEIKF